MSRTVTEGNFFSTIADALNRIDALERLVRAGFLTVPRTIVTVNAYTVVPTNYIIGCTYTGPRSITLPSAVSDVSPSHEIIVKDEAGTAGSNPISVLSVNGETVNGGLSQVINSDYGVLRLYSTATGWMTW